MVRQDGEALKKECLVDIAGILIFLLIGSSMGYLYTVAPRPGPWENVTVGNVPVESFAILYVAVAEQFFYVNNLNVTIQDYSTGATAVDALTRGDIDVAGSSEYVVALNAVEHRNISIVTSVADSQFVDLIARNDRGINSPSDLKGKTVGVAQKTVAEFNMGQFLEVNNISMLDVKVINLAPRDFAKAIVNGSVDAVVTWEPYTEGVKAQLGSGFCDWSIDRDSPFYSVLSCRNDWIKNDPETVGRFVQSLTEAETYVKTHPNETLSLLKNRFNFSSEYLATIAEKTHWTVMLPPTLSSVMENESVWMINNNLTTQKTLPNINDYIYNPS
jgi:ABC-type nitrate/sulfonate/bicarbonate transport system substrate-binding protein